MGLPGLQTRKTQLKTPPTTVSNIVDARTHGSTSRRRSRVCTCPACCGWIVDAILGENKVEVPGPLSAQLSLMGDPFSEDPDVTLEKMKAIWSYIKTQMPRLWKEAQDHVAEDHQRIVRSFEWHDKPIDLKSIAKAGKDRFFINTYDLTHKLIEAAGLPTMADLDSKAFMRISEIIMDDMHDFVSSTGYRE